MVSTIIEGRESMSFSAAQNVIFLIQTICGAIWCAFASNILWVGLK